MRFKKIPKMNPQDRQVPPKFYASPVNSGKITLDDLANRISRSSSLTRGDILNVLSSFLDELPEYLKDGKSVQLGDFGTVRLSFSSDGADTAENVNASLIKNVKVIFTPNVKLKDELRRTPFEEQK
ncbi:MAG: HU family DNA-binding protein [Tannerella sp.]|jgi:predicted histone-like DNA-binding protein|nr:HU family DNA-binding protein [Tannerella sp.]